MSRVRRAKPTRKILDSTVQSVVEVLAEEIPARFLPRILSDLQKKTAEALENAAVPYIKVATLGTSRRLILMIDGLPEKQKERRFVKKGPPVDMAYSPDGIPSLAAVGFAKTANVRVTELVKRKEGNREYVFAETIIPGKKIRDVLKTLLPEVLAKLELPVSMRWGAGEDQFIRPVHSILAMCGKEVIPFRFAGVKSGNYTFPHRITSQQKLVFTTAQKITAAAYLQKMRSAGVLVDPDLRKKEILHACEQLTKKLHARPDWTEDLVNELVYTLEYPIPAVGHLEEAFLNLPKPVLETVLRKQQKYVPLEGRTGELLPQFIFWSDGRRKSANVLKEGNERVVDARLSDARFFFEEDKKTPLALRREQLERVAFLGKLGSIADKVNRLEKLVLWLGEKWKLNADQMEIVQRVAELSKSDLTTELVKEFPELEGVLGAEYARIFGEREEVAIGILEHYRPRGMDDALPKTIPGAVTSIADKLDTLVGGFGIGLTPTGSEDPYGFRRQAAAVIAQLLEHNLSTSIRDVVHHVHGLYRSVAGVGIGKDPDVLFRELWEFLIVRLRGRLEEEGIRYDVVEAAAHGSDDPSRVRVLAKALHGVIDENWMRGVIQTADRVGRLSANAKSSHIEESVLVQAEEKNLHTLLLDVSERVQGAVRTSDFARALKELSRLTEPVEIYFDKVMVMHEDPKLRENRLGMLRRLAELFRSVADLPRIVLQKDAAVPSRVG